MRSASFPLSWRPWRAALGLAGIAALAWASPSPEIRPSRRPVTVRAADSGKSFNLSVGQQLRIELEAQFGTGFRWSVQTEPPAVVTLVSATATPAKNGLGSPELQTFLFAAKQVGSVKLTLVYIRQWEKDRPPAKVFSISLHVQPP